VGFASREGRIRMGLRLFSEDPLSILNQPITNLNKLQRRKKARSLNGSTSLTSLFQ
jgi:hypothetical protein